MNGSDDTSLDPALPTTPLSNEELLLRYRDAREAGAFDELVRRFERELYSYLRRYLGDAALAEDVFQATFLQLHRNCHQYQPGRRVRPWLYSIATHLAIDALRKAGRHPAVSLDSRFTDKDLENGGGALIDLLQAEQPGPLSEAETRERNVRIHEAVDKLPEPLRAAVILVFFQGLKYSEAAEVLGIPLGTVKSRLHAALAKLHASVGLRQSV